MLTVFLPCHSLIQVVESRRQVPSSPEPFNERFSESANGRISANSKVQNKWIKRIATEAKALISLVRLYRISFSRLHWIGFGLQLDIADTVVFAQVRFKLFPHLGCAQ
jgi:hypothetical protein